MLDVCSTYWRIKTQNDWGISQKRSQIFRIMKEMRIVLRFACFLQSLLLFVHFFFLLGIYKVGAVCMCSLSQLVGYISFSITPGCWALVTLGMMVCSLKVFPDLVAHTGFSPLVFFLSLLTLRFLPLPSFSFSILVCVFMILIWGPSLWKHAVRGFPSFFFLCET